jgi:hypothetical protein
MSTAAIIATATTPAAVDIAPAEVKVLETPSELINALVAKIDACVSDLQEVRRFSRIVDRAVAKMAKRKIKRSPNDQSRPSGFTLPVKILPKLTMFLNDLRVHKGLATKTPGECIARTDVTRLVTEYIKTNDLQDPEEKKIIVLDGKLAALFDEEVGSRVTWFKLQSSLAPLYDHSDDAKLENKRQKELAIASAAAAEGSAPPGDGGSAIAEPPKKRAKKPAMPSTVTDDTTSASASVADSAKAPVPIAPAVTAAAAAPRAPKKRATAVA